MEYRIGDNVRAERSRRGWSQGELATRAGLDRSTVYGIERTHRPNLETVEKIARALGLPVSALIHAETASSVGNAGESIPHVSDAGSSSPPAGDEGTAAQRPQKPLPASEGGASVTQPAPAHPRPAA